MDEAKKTNKIRDPEFIKKYLPGKVIDIGAGNDLVCDWAEKFDLENGDANHIARHREPNTYDAVHSSHCLEHMDNPEHALQEWWSLIKKGGHLVLVVPDEDLYEQGYWPSRFNGDHKATFTLKNEKSWSPVSYNIRDLVSKLPGAEVISGEIQDKNYDYDLQTRYPPKETTKVSIGLKVLRKIFRKIPLIRHSLLSFLERKIFLIHHIPIDQTKGQALAQIQVIAKKG
jgi:SAM-dependent methyltransferase